MKNYIAKTLKILKEAAEDTVDAVLLKSEQEKQVKASSRIAENHINRVLLLLDDEKCRLESIIEKAEEELEKAKFSTKWLGNPISALQSIDEKESKLESDKAHLENINFSIEKRKALLAEYSK